MIDRKRLSERVSPALLRIELKRAFGPLLVIVVGVAIALTAAYYIVSNINGGIGGTHTMQFEVANATGVVPGRAETRFYGVHAGVITNAKLEDGHAVLTVTVAKSFGKVYRNATAVLRPNTPLEDMYLDITNRGTPSSGVAPASYTVPISQTQSPVQLSDVLNTFQPDVRAQLNSLLNNFGNGLQDRGASIRQAFVELAPLLSIAGQLTHQVAERASLTKQLVHNTATLTNLLGNRSQELHTFVAKWTNALGQLSTEGGAPLRSTITELPTFLHYANTTLYALLKVEPHVNRAAAALEPVAEKLPQGLSDLKTLATSLEPAVRKLQRPVVKLVPLAQQLQPLAKQLSASLTTLEPQVPAIVTTAQAAADCSDELNEFLNWDSSFGKYSDDLGQFVEGNLNFGFYSVPGSTPSNFTFRKPCAGGEADDPIANTPIPKLDGPAPAP